MMTLPQFFEMTAASSTPELQSTAAQQGFVTALTDLGLIQVSGDDAASYLHNLLSNDIEHLSNATARYAALCTPKGRMLASFLVWKTSTGVFLQLSASIQTAIQKRLQMFVMRAKAKLTDASTEYTALGLGGAAAALSLQEWFPQLPGAVNDKIDTELGSLIRVSDGYGHARYMWIIQSALLAEYWPALQKNLTPSDAAIWRRADIHAGIARIIDKTQEQFVPQMVNFELIGGVNFKKGCYPGQEIVARSQYLGKLKRRMAIASVTSSAVMAGMEVFSEDDPDQPCGMIVNAEAESPDSSICLVELKVADQQADKVHLASADGARLRFLPLPYAMLDITQ
jgi:folate-binding protein YgfZ